MNKIRKINKDIHITDDFKKQLIQFLAKKTGLEWYCFLKPGDITKNLKQYVVDFARCFSDLTISFDSQSDFDKICQNCFEKRGKNRLTFFFNEEEKTLFDGLCKKYNIKTQSYLFFIILSAIINQDKKLVVNLESFTIFFTEKGNAMPLYVPYEIVKKLKNAGFNNKKSLFFRKSLFYQMYFGETGPIENHEYYTVTPKKTNWIRTVFFINDEIKKYITQQAKTTTKTITLLHATNTYLENLV